MGFQRGQSGLRDLFSKLSNDWRYLIGHPKIKEPHTSSELIPTELGDTFSVSFFADVPEQFHLFSTVFEAIY